MLLFVEWPPPDDNHIALPSLNDNHMQREIWAPAFSILAGTRCLFSLCGHVNNSETHTECRSELVTRLAWFLSFLVITCLFNIFINTYLSKLQVFVIYFSPDSHEPVNIISGTNTLGVIKHLLKKKPSTVRNKSAASHNRFEEKNCYWQRTINFTYKNSYDTFTADFSTMNKNNIKLVTQNYYFGKYF